MDIPFVHLHCHSHYSLLDGSATIPKLVRRARELGMPALALTDHGNLYGALEFYKAASRPPDKPKDKFDETAIKPIFGYEAYIATTNRFDKTAKSQKESHRHLTLLAMNPTGFRNLIKMSSLAFAEGMRYDKPRIDKDLLQQYNEGLICLSGCLSSEFSQKILHDENDACAAAKEVARWYRDLFGDRYYIELQYNGLEDQRTVLGEAVKIARELGIPTVATSDVHYIHQNDFEAQDILLCIATGAFRTDLNRMRFDSDQFFFRSGRNMLEAMPGQEDAIRRTIEISERINCALDIDKLHFPSFTPPDGLSSDEYLRKLCIEGLKKRYADNPKRFKNGELSREVMERLDRELGVIAEKKLPNYFLIVWDFVRFAEDRGIHRTARGSGVGALVCYALNMSHVCPLEFDLLFERFLDVERKSMPDIDIDFDQDRRGEVLEYVKQKYGEANVAQIGTFSTLAARQSILDVGKALNHPGSLIDSIKQLVPERPGVTIDKALEENEELNKRYESDTATRELIVYAKQLEGVVRGAGVHACAVVIADKPLIEYLPLQRDKENAAVTQWEGPAVEAAGLLKMDFLGLRNLTVLAHAIEIIEQTTGKTIDPYKFPLDDKKTFELLCRGETKGIFQLESGGMRELVQRMKPDNFRDIIALLALYRPGTLKGGVHDQYVDVKHGHKTAKYAHPVMEEILRETYGFMVYQEQIMRILNRLGNISLSSSYACIKAIGKKDEAKIAGYREQFINGAKANGLTVKKGEEIFDLIFNFAGYGFNKSHSTAYALIAYMTAYLKVHYPTEFMAALLCGDISERNFKKKDSTVEHIEDCKRMNVTVVPPDINQSEQLYTLKDGKIIFAIRAVDGCRGGIAADAIVATRREGGPFRDLFDFCDRIDPKLCPKAIIEKLIKAGAFDALGGRRSQLMQILDGAYKAALNAVEDRNRGQKNLFAAINDEPEHIITKKPVARLPDIPEWPDKEKAIYEKETLGYYVSAHPLQEQDELFQNFRTCTCREARVLPAWTPVILAGMIGGIKMANTNNPDPGKSSLYANFDLEDTDGDVRSIIWPEKYEKYRDLVKPESIVFAVGKMNRKKSRDETSADGNFIVDALYTVEAGPQALSRGFEITLDETKNGIDGATKLHEILRNYPGRSEVELSIRMANGSLALFRPSKLRIDMNADLRRRVVELLGGDAVRWLKAPLRQPDDDGGGRRRWRREE